jgi:hypothetical protein
MTNPVQVRSGALSLASDQFPGGSSPNPFGTTLIFDTPYEFAGGDLVLLFSHGTGTFAAGGLDAIVSTDPLYSDSSIRAFQAGSYQATTATASDVLVPVFALEVTSVPEPGPMSLLGAGLGAVVWMRRKRHAGRQ